MTKIGSSRVSTMWVRGAAAMFALVSSAATGFSFAQVQGAMIERIVAQSGGPGVSPVELERKTLIATDSPVLNDVILPMVVNGAVAEKLHYQTIFTVLNASSEDVRATLHVYSNAGVASGAFCSPIAPAPSSITFTMSPNGQYLQFTSSDLPFLNGWARLNWEGPATLLVSEELTLVAAAPSPCLLICNRPSTEKLSSAQISAVMPMREFKLPMIINENRQTAVGLINPSSTDTAIVRVSILDSSGQSARLAVPDRFEIKIRPLERISKFIWDMAFEQSSLPAIPSPPGSFQGSVVFSSDSPFVTSGLHVMFPEGKFVPVAVISTR